MSKKIDAIFFDRDGVLIKDTHLLVDEKEISPLQGIRDLIEYLTILKLKLFVVTNQTVVARGLLSYQKAISLNDKVIKSVTPRSIKNPFLKTYLCPHHPEATIKKYRVRCTCRKPSPGMILNACEEFNINANNSILIGDRTSDVIAGNKAGCKTIQILSGMHSEKTIMSDIKVLDKETKPHYLVKNLLEVIPIIEELI